MKSGTVSTSEILSANRLDAAFHLAAKGAEEQTRALQSRFSQAQATTKATALLDAMPLVLAVAAMSPLCRGARPDRAGCIRAITEYPHLALARLAERIDQAKAINTTEIAQRQRRNEILDGLTQEITVPSTKARGPRGP